MSEEIKIIAKRHPHIKLSS